MRSAFPLLSAAALSALILVACGSSPAPAPSPTPTPTGPSASPAPSPEPPPAPPAPPAPAPLNLSGRWDGAANDSQGATYVDWSLFQNGDAITGTVTTNAVNPNDGSCNSCHRNKSGSISGTLSGTALSITMAFAAGVNGDPTPACQATMTGSTPHAADDTFTIAYTGSDSCEGNFAKGTLVIRRKH
jgi:hypothetical protein